MSSVQDYLRSQNAELDAGLEKLIKGLGQYNRNTQVLQSLGTEDKSKKSKNFLSKALNILGAGGRLVTGGVLEAIGAPTREQQRTSGWDEVKKLLSGEIQVSGRDLPILKANKNDTILQKIGKTAGGFAVDVALDPLSWVGAPSSIARKGAAENLINIASDVKFLDNILSRSVKGAELVGELAARNPKTVRALEAGTSLLETAGEAGVKQAAAQTVASDLGTAFLTRGRQGVIKNLEELTGSRAQAIAVFKGLPEEIKGGLVLRLPTGKQIGRLTSGTGTALGPVAGLANDVRQVLGVAGNPITRSFSGLGGDIVADVKKAEILKRLGKEVPADISQVRLIDYPQFKKAMAASGTTAGALEGAHVTAMAEVAALSEKHTGEALDEFNKGFRDGYFTPGKNTVGVDSTAYNDGIRAGEALKAHDVNTYEQAKEANLDIGNIGDPFEYSMLQLTQEEAERRAKLGVAKADKDIYRMEEGRGSEIRVSPDEDTRLRAGWEDPKNPGVMYVHAVAANDLKEKAALAAGKSAEEAKLARIYEEDPVKLSSKYNTYMKQRLARHRFIQVMEETGTLVRDIPQARKLLNEWTSSTMAAGIKGVMPEVKQYFEKRAAAAREEIEKVVSTKSAQEVKDAVAASRQVILNDAEAARVTVADLRAQVAQATEEVATAAPQINRLRTQLDQYAKTSREVEVALEGSERAVKNVNARMRTAEKNLQKVGDELDAAKALRDEAVNAGDVAAVEQYDMLITRLGDDAADAQEKFAREEAIKQENTAELDNIRQMRSSAREQGAAEAERQIIAYEQAVTRRNTLVDQLTEARAARDTAVAAARQVERTLGIEQVTNLESIVMGYVDAVSEVSKIKAANPITRGMDKATRDSIKSMIAQAQVAADVKKKILREVLRAGKGDFSAAARDYAEEVFKAAEKLNDEQFKAFTVIASEEKIGKLLETLVSGARDDAQVMQAVSDIYTTFKSIRDIIPEESFSKMAEAQQKLLSGTGFDSLRDKLIREETQAGKIGEKFVGMGYEAVGKGRGMKDMFATRSVIEAMNSLYKTTADTNAWTKFIAEYIDPFLSMWKVATTTGRGPGFVINNLVGGMLNNHIGNVEAKYAKLAFDTMMEMRNAVVKLEKMYPTKSFYEINRMAEELIASRLNRVRVGDKGMGDLFVEFTKMGGTEATDLSVAIQRGLKGSEAMSAEALRRGTPRGFVYQEPATSRAQELFRTGIDTAMTWRGQRWMNDVAQSSEIFLRFQAFMDGYAKYGNLESAMSKVHMLHFDYKNLGPGEEWMRRIVPFYTWMRNNVPLQLRTLVLQPGKIQKFVYAQENLQKTLGAEGDDSWMNQVMPEWLANNNGFITMIDSGIGKLALSNKLPFGDINNFLSWQGSLPEINKLGLISGVGPGLRVPIEALTGRNLQTGAPREDGVAVSLLKDLLPQLGMVQRIGTAVEQIPGVPNIPGTKEDKALSETLSLLGIPAIVGLQAQTIGPKQITGELYRRGDVQSKQIAEAASQLGVDLEWLRKRLSKGVPPEVLAAMVRAGAGRVRQGLPETSDLSANSKTKTLNILQGLQSP